MGVDIDVIYEGDLHCQAIHRPSKNQLVTDAPVDNGGKGAAFSPTDLVATALGSCMVTIMGKVAQRSNLPLEGTRIHVVKDMAADPVRRIGCLSVTISIPKGSQLLAKDRAKLEAAAATCPVKQSLHPDVKIVTTFVYEE